MALIGKRRDRRAVRGGRGPIQGRDPLELDLGECHRPALSTLRNTPPGPVDRTRSWAGRLSGGASAGLEIVNPLRYDRFHF
jgi:hypothetical protein